MGRREQRVRARTGLADHRCASPLLGALGWIKAGLDPRIMCDVINAGSGRNSATQDKFPKSVLPRTFDFGFTTNLMIKDIQFFVDEAEGMGLNVARAVRDLWQATLNEEGPTSDFSRIAAVVERRAGIEIKSKG